MLTWALGISAPAVADWVNGHTGGTQHDSTVPAGAPSAGGRRAGVAVSWCMACGTCLLYAASHTQGSEVPAGLRMPPDQGISQVLYGPVGRGSEVLPAGSRADQKGEGEAKPKPSMTGRSGEVVEGLSPSAAPHVAVRGCFPAAEVRLFHREMSLKG